MKRIYSSVLLVLLLLASTQLDAQVTNNEGFESSFPPSGWTIATGASGATWSRATAGVHPSLSPHGGSYLAVFSSYSYPSGVQAMITPAYSLVNRGSNTPTVSFWMYRDNNWATYHDYVDVYMNTSASLSGATSLGRVYRYYTDNPSVTTANAWYQYSFNVPAGFNGATNYLIIQATSAYGSDVHIDDVQWISYPAVCSGTPTPGNTLLSNAICNSSTSFTLSLQNLTSGTGVTYQWQSSSNGTTWSNISGATNATYTTTQSTATYYRCGVTCSGNTGYSNSLYATMGATSLPFLESFPTSGLPSCWVSSEGAGGATYHWVSTTADATHGASGPQSGSGFAYLYTFLAQTSYNPYYLTSPSIILPAGNCKLSYYYYLGAGGFDATYTQPLTVEISTNGGSSWSTLFGHTTANSVTATSSSTSFWTLNTINLNSYAGSTIMIRFKTLSNYGNGYCDQGLDEVAVKLNAPTATNSAQCGSGTPTCSVASTTGVTTPSFRWYTSSSGGTAIAGQTGATLSSYPISSSTSFYVSEIVSGVESDRTQVDAVVNPIPNASVTSVTQIQCFNGTGSATTTIQAGTGTSPFSYSWNSTPGQSTATATLTAGSYICTVTDSKGCTDTATVTLNNASPSTVTTITTQPTSSTICSGTNTSFTAAGTGLGTITYQWWVNPGSGFVSLTDVGIYSGSATATLNLTNATGAYSGYQYRCVVTGTCGSVTTNTVTLTVNSFVPTASVSPASGTNVCQGTPITFTANITNGGSGPTYQWSVDGTNVTGATNNTYTTSTLSPGFHGVRVTLTSNAACTFPLTVTSSVNYFVNVIATVTPTISIVESPNDTICAGASVTFTSSISNGGNSPTYQWKINSTNVATTTNYTTTGLVNGDVVSCILTSNATCRTSNTANSNNIPMTVNPIVTPLLSIATNNTTICSGDQMTFTSTPTYPGTAPTYQWQINGNNAGTNNSTFTASGFNNNDVVTCTMTSNFACVVPPTAASNPITVTVLQRPIPSLTITATPGINICTGTTVNFSTTPVNGGTNPTYQWLLNGITMTGATSGIYAASVLNAGDIVTCVMNSSAVCATPPTVTSNSLKFNVTATTPPSGYIVAKKGNIINTGDTVTFTAIVVNAGTAPTYIWKKNGTAIPGATGLTLVISDLENNDQITLTIHSSNVCSSPDSGTSNSVTMLVNTGIGNTPEQALRDIKLYPNPNAGHFTIEAKLGALHSEKDASIDVVNNIGQLVYRGTLPIVSGQIKKDIQLDNAVSGVYFVRISVGDENFIERFIVQ